MLSNTIFDYSDLCFSWQGWK